MTTPSFQPPSPEVLRKVRDLALRTRRKVDGYFASVYRSVFKGQGLSFLSVRPYEPGDDVRQIDWKVTARTNVPHIKQYIEERDLTVLLVLDVSASMHFGTIQRHKRELAAEIGALLALAAARNNDKVGLLLFSDRIERYVAPQRGSNHGLRVIRELLATETQSTGTDLEGLLKAARGLLKQRAIIFLLSDFLAPPTTYYRQLLYLNSHHDLVALSLIDPLEMRWENIGVIPVRDLETGHLIPVDTGSRRWRREFAARSQARRQRRDDTLKRAHVAHLELRVDADYTQAFITFLKQRANLRQMA